MEIIGVDCNDGNSPLSHYRICGYRDYSPVLGWENFCTIPKIECFTEEDYKSDK